MQINKKIFTVAITALLLLSILAVAAPAFALTAPNTHIGTNTAITATTGAQTTPNIAAVLLANVFVSPAAPGSALTNVVVGQKVVVSGTDAAAFNSVKVYFDTVSDATLIGSTSAGAPPNQANPTNFNVTVTIPSAVNGVHNLIVSDGVNNVGMPITVASTVSRGLTTPALPGDSITLTGNGFAATAVVTLTLTAPNGTTTIAFPPTVAANASGSFSLTTTIPTTITTVDFSATAWTITATQATLTATTTVTIDYYVTVTPTSGPLGITATISGRIPASTAVTVTFGTATAFTTTSGTDGKFTGTYNTLGVPLVPGSTYAIVATWGPVGLTVSRTATPGFTVNAAVPTIAALTVAGVPVAAAQAGTVVTITVTGFSNGANATLSFGTTVVNSTATDVRFGPTGATGSATPGGFTAEFTVPALTVGAYTLTVTDQFGASATTPFTISAAPVTIITTATSFAQGDTISFRITTTDPAVLSVLVAIKDPTGLYWWGTPTTPITWLVDPNTAALASVPIARQTNAGGILPLTLPANAPTGSWNWTISYLPSTGVPTTATGLFAVVAGGVSGITTQINALNTTLVQINGTLATLQQANGTSITAQINALSAQVTSISGSIATLSTSMGTVTASVNSLSSSISSINGGIATVQTSLGTITTSLSSLDAVLGAVAGDTATLKTSVGDVTTSLASIGTTVTSINGNVATVQTDLGTLKGTVTSISGNIATIQTDIGTLKADVSSTKSATDSLSPLVIVAIVLALIAAIAAIASIVLMRRKIAG